MTKKGPEHAVENEVEDRAAQKEKLRQIILEQSQTPQQVAENLLDRLEVELEKSKNALAAIIDQQEKSQKAINRILKENALPETEKKTLSRRMGNSSQ